MRPICVPGQRKQAGSSNHQADQQLQQRLSSCAISRSARVLAGWLSASSRSASEAAFFLLFNLLLRQTARADCNTYASCTLRLSSNSLLPFQSPLYCLKKKDAAVFERYLEGKERPLLSVKLFRCLHDVRSAGGEEETGQMTSMHDADPCHPSLFSCLCPRPCACVCALRS